jgi:cytoskeletal protein CcmA (bactofilin family)|tara:strand:+ start:219 stop:638 length:420 start_codon:yes stop_codon:yes gene_type:complete
MTDSKSEYEFYVGPDTLLEGASLEINGTARIDGTIVGKVTVNHLIVGPKAKVQGDIRGETALVEGTVEDTIEIKSKLTVQSSGRIRGKISYGSLETQEGAKLVGELFTDWDNDDISVPEPPTDRLSSLVSSVSSEEEDE